MKTKASNQMSTDSYDLDLLAQNVIGSFSYSNTVTMFRAHISEIYLCDLRPTCTNLKFRSDHHPMVITYH